MAQEQLELPAVRCGRGLFVVVVLSLIGSMGCGEPGTNDHAAATSRALGSDWPTPVDIWDWWGLSHMDPTGNYLLRQNLDQPPNTNWTPIDFFGTFDGGGNQISHLRVNDPYGRAGALFSSIQNAKVHDLILIDVRATGTNIAAGLAGLSTDSDVDRVAVEGTVSGASEGGGIIGRLDGGTLTHSYFKGTVDSSTNDLGGLVGDGRAAKIIECYAQATVTGNTSDFNGTTYAGGLVGTAWALDIHDAYAVGDVTGRGAVGGIVASEDCDEQDPFYLYKTIYRGHVEDINRPEFFGGWAGTVGTRNSCTGRWLQNYWDSSIDSSINFDTGTEAYSEFGVSTYDLQWPTGPHDGVFCLPDVADPNRCGDNTFSSDNWNAGSSNEYHTLTMVIRPEVQPRN